MNHPQTTTEKLIAWPSPQDYNEAVQHLASNTADPELQNGMAYVNALGLPAPRSGSFASVYRVRSGQNDLAIRCFLHDTADRQTRYEHIAEFVRSDTLPYTVMFDFLRKGIRVNGKWFPVLKMDWVEGLNLDEYVEQQLGTPQLPRLADSFLKMCRDLRDAGIAHGDLQHGNIIVCNHELRLVDYDGMFVPSMSGFHSIELGHRNYQHPKRDATSFGPHLDNFSAWVIYASLRALAIDPELYRHLCSGDDCLLFRRDDFIQPEYSYTFGSLEEHHNEEIRALARFLRWQCKSALEQVPPLDNRVPALPELPPVERVSARRAPRMVPARKRAQHTAMLIGTSSLVDQHQLPDVQIEPELNQRLPRCVEQAIPTPPKAGIRPSVWIALLAWFCAAMPVIFVLQQIEIAAKVRIFIMLLLVIVPLFLLFAKTPDDEAKEARLKVLKWLAEYGEATLAVITVAEETDLGGGQKAYNVQYEFFDSNGRHFSRRAVVNRNLFDTLKVSSKATVLYDPARPEANLLYSLSPYRAVIRE